MARRLYDALQHVESLRLSPPQVNSMYPVLPLDAKRALQDRNFFWDWDESISQVRWMTSWDTTAEDVDRFAAGVLHFLGK
jgi:threonine aldolase